MNLYKAAIEKDEVLDFFRGKNSYFDLDRDRGIHNKAFTSMHIIDYGITSGESLLYKQLNYDLEKYIKEENFSFNDLNTIINIIWFYNIYRREEQKLKTDWNIPNEIIIGIREKVNFFQNNGIDVSNIFRVVDNLKNRFDFALL